MGLEQNPVERRVEYAIPKGKAARLSFEVGHLYLDDIATGSKSKGQKKMRQFFRPIVGMVDAVRKSYTIEANDYSTCFMVDDYGKLESTTPEEVLGGIVLPAAEAVGLRIDYIVREGGCARLAGPFMSSLSGITTDSYTTPTLQESVWLSRLERLQGGKPTPQSEPDMGSVRMDIELARNVDGTTTYSCPFLAAIFQNLRLGLLYDPSNPDTIAQPVEEFGDNWGKLPVIMQLRKDAPPFEAFRSFSYLSERFMEVENAVRSILDSLVLAQLPGETRMQALANTQGYRLNPSPSNRRGYAFT